MILLSRAHVCIHQPLRIALKQSGSERSTTVQLQGSEPTLGIKTSAKRETNPMLEYLEPVLCKSKSQRR